MASKKCQTPRALHTSPLSAPSIPRWCSRSLHPLCPALTLHPYSAPESRRHMHQQVEWGNTSAAIGSTIVVSFLSETFCKSANFRKFQAENGSASMIHLGILDC